MFFALVLLGIAITLDSRDVTAPLLRGLAGAL